MKFKKEFLRDIVYGETDVEIVEDTIVDTTRWSVLHSMIFKVGSKYYQTGYSEGATESQDEQPFEYDPDEIVCTEVEQVPKTVMVWEKV